MKTIVVNNPAARSSGALTILKEFLNKINTLKCDKKFIVIVSLEELKKYETDRVKIHIINPQGFKERIIWDNIKLKNYLKSKNIKPDLFISIQNTGVNLNKNIPQIIYYHQALSIVDLKWNFFQKNQRLYWMYKNIYPIFIKQYLNRTKKVIVQTNWVKECFHKKFNYPKKDILLMTPKIKDINIEEIKTIPKNKFRIFYPASSEIYKNHKIIVEILYELKKENLIKEIECIFTLSKTEDLEIEKLIKKYKLENIIRLVGKIPYDKVLEYYKSSDVMLFPSYLESFGLPLIEAQQFGINILVADLKYSKEVVGNYKNVEFLELKREVWKKTLKEKILEFSTRN